jgi:simple sugar transport system ATP-binding protein
MMVGSELPSPETRESTVTTDVALEVTGLTVNSDEGGRALLDDVSFTIHRGEVLGIAGVEGNGQTELVDAILGITDGAVGRIVLFGDDITNASTRDRRAAGIGYIPEDRHKDGMVLPFPLWENCVLGHQAHEPFGNGIWIDKAASVERTEQIIENFDVRTPSAFVPALTLSGGNQQKLIVGREMMTDPKVLIASHPTRGIDVGAQAAIWDVIRTARALGLGVLLISADLEELIGLSDTLQVIYRGRIVARLDPGDVTPKLLGSYMTGAETDA